MRMVRKSDPQQYQDLLNLRSCNPKLKVLVTTGINNYNNRTDSKMFSKLINSTVGRRMYAVLGGSFGPSSINSGRKMFAGDICLSRTE
ncbi:hypothetical protein HPB48_004024 [Haemaphysalis longicornis]|uniref:Uncharacterized protein n=1 Tax=Haemaphysalis longicornis TaxID=44386 RepID=A0A9J6G2W5_HAELO|nr:hypothetical protein HPB48_004024 [Haemaphysalis longicornis]